MIDSGFSKQKFYNPVSSSPFILFISLTSALCNKESISKTSYYFLPDRFRISKVWWWHQYPKHLLDKGLVGRGEFGLESVTGIYFHVLL